jgi:putative lipoprotein
MRFYEAILAIIVLSIASPALAAKIDLSGQVTYRERIALPDGALLRIQLIDQTLPNTPPRVAVEAPIGPGQVPLSFDLKFDDALILPNHAYALIASISDQGGLLFRNAEPYAVAPLAPATPVVIVTDLVARTELPVSASTATQAPVAPAILDTLWTATLIAGAAPVPRSAISLTIGADMRAGGTGGCNAYFSQAELDGDKLAFSSVAATRKACADTINQQEQAFFAALAATASWQVSGDDLTLFGADGKALLMFRR